MKRKYANENNMKEILAGIDQLKTELDKLRPLDNDKIREALAIELYL